MLLLLSHFSRVRLFATPQMAAHQAPPSLGFSRQEHWSGLPFPSPMHQSEKWKWSRSVVSDSIFLMLHRFLKIFKPNIVTMILIVMMTSLLLHCGCLTGTFSLYPPNLPWHSWDAMKVPLSPLHRWRDSHTNVMLVSQCLISMCLLI